MDQLESQGEVIGSTRSSNNGETSLLVINEKDGMDIDVVVVADPAAMAAGDVTSAASATAIVYTQMSPTFSGLDLGSEWVVLNRELSRQNYQMVILVSDPKHWCLLSVGMMNGDSGRNSNSNYTVEDVFSSDAAKILAEEEKQALEITITAGNNTTNSTTTLNDLSNIAIVTNYELYPVVKELYDVATGYTNSSSASSVVAPSAEEEEGHEVGNDLMAHISGSAYSVPKVFDFLLRVLYPATTVVRFDSNVVVDTLSLPQSFQTDRMIQVVQRAVAIRHATAAMAKNKNKNKNNNGTSAKEFVLASLAFSSRYVDPNKEGSLSGLEWSNAYSTRPNPALLYEKLLEKYSVTGAATPPSSPIIHAHNFSATKTAIHDLETQYYHHQQERYNVSQQDASRALFLAAVDDHVMNEYYDRLSPYVPRNSSTSNCLDNAVVSGAGMVLPSSYAALHAPRLNFGQFARATMDHVRLGKNEQHIADLAESYATDWGLISDGKLSPNVMWIDDQSTADYIVQQQQQQASLDTQTQTQTPTATTSQVGVLPDPDPTAFISKTRGAPDNPLWYTLQYYMPTLLSGFLLQQALQLNSINEIHEDSTAIVWKNFCSIFPERTIGTLYCTFLSINEVMGAWQKAYEEEQYWDTVVSPDWAALCHDEQFVSELRQKVNTFIRGQAADAPTTTTAPPPQPSGAPIVAPTVTLLLTLTLTLIFT